MRRVPRIRACHLPGGGATGQVVLPGYGIWGVAQRRLQRLRPSGWATPYGQGDWHRVEGAIASRHNHDQQIPDGSALPAGAPGNKDGPIPRLRRYGIVVVSGSIYQLAD